MNAGSSQPPRITGGAALFCPLCGEPNGCIAAAGAPAGTPCWCANATFTPELLARVPPALRRKACICARCAADAAKAAENTHTAN
ncbi:MAG: cysteine-rich CWC family protein [Ottowia sp.]|nr:cysteine-rich CWC family protein [Ottowia sp.]MBQ9578676.1 cysteine-rich CWC family protein [Ottowia sp.]